MNNKSDFFGIDKLLKEIDSKDLILHLTGTDNSDNFRTVTPELTSSIKEEITNLIIKQLNYFNSLELKEYNIVGKNDDTIEKVELKDYSDYFDKIKKSFDVPVEVNKAIDTNNYDFFTFCYGNNEKTVYFLRKINRMRALKQGLICKLVNNKFSILDPKGILGIDNNIDLLIYDNQIYIFHHIAFERIFKLRNEFKEKAEKVLNNKIFKEKISNFDNLKKDALNNRNYIKRLAKLEGKNVTLFLDKIEKTEKVIEKFSLDIEVENEKLIYRDNTQAGNFINLMQDSYYQTLIGEKQGIDDKRWLIWGGF